MNNLQNMYNRLNNLGGNEQHHRMIKGKNNTFHSAIESSYQAAQVSLVDFNTNFIRESKQCLINPNKLSADYDEKILSVDQGCGFKPGKIIKWFQSYDKVLAQSDIDDTFWLIYLEDLTETSYFRASIRKCNHFITWKNNGQEYNSYIAIRGPKEQTISSTSKSSFMMDIPNYTISFLMPKNNETISYFQRYAKFYLQSFHNATPTRWRVETVDSISLPGVLEIFAKEYIDDNDMDDNNVDILGNQSAIVGEGIIKPKFTYTYVYEGEEKSKWSFDKNLPIDIISENDNQIVLSWSALYSDNFKLFYGNNEKNIQVTSLI